MKFNLVSMQKRGASGIKATVGLVVFFVLVANMAPSMLSSMFNTTRWTCADWNASDITECFTTSGVGTWVPLTLGILAVVGLIYLMIDNY